MEKLKRKIMKREWEGESNKTHERKGENNKKYKNKCA